MTKKTSFILEYFSITTEKPEEFLAELDKVCQKFAVKGKAYSYNWMETE